MQADTLVAMRYPGRQREFESTASLPDAMPPSDVAPALQLERYAQSCKGRCMLRSPQPHDTMPAETLYALFVDELRDAYDAEKQLLKALRKMARAAQHPELGAAFTLHHEETTAQVGMLEDVFAMLELKPRGKHCPGIAGILEEGKEALEEMEKSAVRDAALVGGGKRAEHYEIAAYTTLVAMAKALGRRDAADRLQEILSQEIATDKKLDALAKQLLPLATREADD